MFTVLFSHSLLFNILNFISHLSELFLIQYKKENDDEDGSIDTQHEITTKQRTKL
jgi:hypothetical protein